MTNRTFIKEAMLFLFIMIHLIVPNKSLSQQLTVQGDTLRIVLIGSYLNFKGNGFAPFDSFNVNIETTVGDTVIKTIMVAALSDSSFSGSFFIDSVAFKPKVYFCRVRVFTGQYLKDESEIIAEDKLMTADANLDEIVGEVSINNYSSVIETSTNQVQLNLWANYRGKPVKSVFISNCTNILGTGNNPPDGGQDVLMGTDEVIVNSWMLNISGASQKKIFAKFWDPCAMQLVCPTEEYSTVKEDYIYLQPVNMVKVNLKVFLEGPYDILNGDIMTTLLTDGGYLPLEHPYNNDDWDCISRECIGTIPSDIVDWILIEIRTGILASTKVDCHTAFVKSDGSVVDLDGVSLPGFLLPEGNYYVVIYHRNHLAVMSSAAVHLSMSSSLYDFTTAQSKAYTIDSDAMVNLKTGLYAIIAGDTNNSNVITNSDKTPIINNINKPGYFYEDTNLSGVVTNSDKNFINLNNNKWEQVP